VIGPSRDNLVRLIQHRLGLPLNGLLAGRRGGGLYLGRSDSVFTQTGESLIAHDAISDTGRDGDGGGSYLGDGCALLEGGDYTLGGGFWGGGEVAEAEEHSIYLPLILRD